MESSYENNSFRPSRPTSGPQAEQLAAYRRKEALHEIMKKLIAKFSVEEIRSELDSVRPRALGHSLAGFGRPAKER